jgi:hypothetical protein
MTVRWPPDLARICREVLASVNSRRADRLLRLLNDEDFIRLRSAFVHNAILWDEFRSMKMPQGLSPRHVWEVMAAIDRGGGFSCRSCSPTLANCWYTITPPMAAMLCEFEARCGSGSRLAVALSRRESPHFVIQPLIDDMLACAHRDGLDIQYEAVRELISEGRQPQSDAERIIVNVHDLIISHAQYACAPFSPDLMAALANGIMDGVTDLGRPAPPTEIRVVDPGCVDTTTVLDWICSWENEDCNSVGGHPLIVAVQIAAALWAFRPLPHCNAMLELLLRRLYLERHGYTVLAYVSLGALHLGWEQGRLRPPDVDAAYGEAWRESDIGGDQTPYYMAVLGLMRMGLDALERAVCALELRDQRLIGRIAQNKQVNYRQQAVLEQALLTLDAEFDIATHVQRYAVVPSTARSDFLGLVDAGFLFLERRGKKLLFRAHSDLKVRLEHHEFRRLFV